jgi:hypothetical protein
MVIVSDSLKNVFESVLNYGTIISSLHSFGREAGREIYQIVKQIVI